MDYAFAALAFLATCLAILGKAHGEQAGLALYRRITAFGWTAVVLAAVTLTLQLYRAGRAADEQMTRAAIATESLFTKSVGIAQLAVNVEILNSPSTRSLPKEHLISRLADIRLQLEGHRQSVEARAPVWMNTLPATFGKDIDILLERVRELLLMTQLGQWSPEKGADYAARVQAAAAQLNAKLCEHAKLSGMGLFHPLYFSPCKADGKEWNSAKELHDEIMERARRL